MTKFEAFFFLLPMIGQALTGIGAALGAGAGAAGAAGAGAAGGLGSALSGMGSALGLGGAGGAGAAGGAAGGLGGVSGMLSPLLKSAMGGGGGGGAAPPQVNMAHAQPKGAGMQDLQALVERRANKKLGL